MVKQAPYPPPRRKEPGLIGKTLSVSVAFMVWLILSLVISIIIEWIGMIWFWPEQGAGHAKAVLIADRIYLNSQQYAQSLTIKSEVIASTHEVVAWMADQSRFKRIVKGHPGKAGRHLSVLGDGVEAIYQRHEVYLQAAMYVTQTFVIRLALITLSLPLFILAAVVGAVDGLVERDLRRWGGGRESSNVFNLARRSVVPAFIGACVIYISLPVSINPAFILLPFALLTSLAVRVTLERLKKYF